MVEKQYFPGGHCHPSRRRSISPAWRARGLAFCLLAGSPLSLLAQYQDLNSVPLQSSNPDGTMSARDMQMMQVRQQARSLQGEAASSSMARSAERTMDQQNVDRAVQEARELKAMKRSAADRLKWERTNARVQKVSANDMNSWTTGTGSVRVERDVPNAFIASLIAEEEEAMRRGTLERKKKRLSPSDLNPFRKKESVESYIVPVNSVPLSGVAASTAAPQAQSRTEEEKKGFFGRMKFPGFGGGDDPEEDIPDAPVFRGSGTGTAETIGNTEASPQARSIQERSGAALVDGGAAPGVAAEEVVGSGTSARLTSFSEPAPEEEKGGLFSAFRKSDPEPRGMTPEKSKSGGGLFSFGKKKSQTGGPTIDASLFPAGAADQAPTGGSLSGGYTADDVAEDMAAAPSTTGSLALPGEEPGKKKFGLSMPGLSFPSLSSAGDSGSQRESSVPTMTTINSQGNDYYVLTNTAQFMVHGEEQMQSEVRALGAGNVVRMTRPGEQWAAIRLPNGTEGVVQNKYLRAATIAEARGQFTAVNQDHGIEPAP